MGPKLISKLDEQVEQWKTLLESLVPDSYVKKYDINSNKLFAWFFTAETSLGFKRSIEIIFFKSCKVSIKSGGGDIIDELESFEEVEGWILEYFATPAELPKPPSIQFDLPNLEVRKAEFTAWYEYLCTLFVPYGVEVDINNKHAVFVLYLPTLESVLRNPEGIDFDNIEYQDQGFYLKNGEDWKKIIQEQIVPSLKEMYELSSSKLPDIKRIMDSFEPSSDL